ncbi:hypothetical protein LOY42_16225 [Pseudomonas sp. B21-023]|uniref:hypothetical protein n=1 Tax=Pseudomonas sp. B21-023 TaxID=2895477 RepID=UPI00215FB6B6|nr:hypothetical protein [Pseudomonas sp. B21-023]UVM14840.1 hypothetical protein LOY42_16225 [Pseudomonas sp. B21-023]
MTELEKEGPAVELFVYLNERCHAEAWVKGGEVPVNPASAYRSIDRSGIYTPDENFTVDSSIPVDSVPGVRFEVSNGGVLTGSVTNNFGPQGRLSDLHIKEYSHWDGWIMCFCTTQSRMLAKKFNGKAACVKIKNLPNLKKALDEQLGSISEGKHCKYTDGHLRNPFLKSSADSWQCEYRLFWKNIGAQRRLVQLPAGTGELVALY